MNEPRHRCALQMEDTSIESFESFIISTIRRKEEEKDYIVRML
jgi:hypothetical protein